MHAGMPSVVMGQVGRSSTVATWYHSTSNTCTCVVHSVMRRSCCGCHNLPCMRGTPGRAQHHTTVVLQVKRWHPSHSLHARPCPASGRLPSNPDTHPRATRQAAAPGSNSKREALLAHKPGCGHLDDVVHLQGRRLQRGHGVVPGKSWVSFLGQSQDLHVHRLLGKSAKCSKQSASPHLALFWAGEALVDVPNL